MNVPTVADRIVTAAARIVFEPIVDADFPPSSYRDLANRADHEMLNEVGELDEDAVRRSWPRAYRDWLPECTSRSKCWRGGSATAP
jgi:hypothetical protein